MFKISNKTLFALLLFTIILSLASTFISLNKLGQLTGLAQANVTTQSGTTSVTVLGAAQITLYNDTINFGSGQVNGTYTVGHDFCVLQTNGTIISAGNDFTGSGFGPGGQSAACDPFTSPPPWSFVIENTGNVNFTNVTMSSLGGNTAFQRNFSSSVNNGTWTYRMAEEGGVDTSCAADSINQSLTYVAVPVAATSICDNFLSTGTNDAIMIQINVSLPEDAAAAIWSDTVTFTGLV